MVRRALQVRVAVCASHCGGGTVNFEVWSLSLGCIACDFNPVLLVITPKQADADAAERGEPASRLGVGGGSSSPVSRNRQQQQQQPRRAVRRRRRRRYGAVLMDFGSARPAVTRVTNRMEALSLQEDAEVGLFLAGSQYLLDHNPNNTTPKPTHPTQTPPPTQPNIYIPPCLLHSSTRTARRTAPPPTAPRSCLMWGPTPPSTPAWTSGASGARCEFAGWIGWIDMGRCGSSTAWAPLHHSTTHKTHTAQHSTAHIAHTSHTAHTKHTRPPTPHPPATT
jgi:hypothetical protein